jgi:hypothetical protein
LLEFQAQVAVQILQQQELKLVALVVVDLSAEVAQV